MKFKTNAKCGGCISAIGLKLNKIMKAGEWSVDSASKVLEVKADISPDKVIEAVISAGFEAEQISE